MLKSLTNVSVWVHDQDEALAFYTEKLGFELRQDVTVPEMGNFRWLTVGLPGQDVGLALLTIPGPPVFDADTQAKVQEILAKSSRRPLLLHRRREGGAAEALKGRGVEFQGEPEQQPYGIDVGFRDPSGNQMRLAQLSDQSG